MVKSTLNVMYLVFLTVFTFASAVCLAQKPELVVQTGHSGIVDSLAFTPDGKLLASGSWDRTIKLWDVATGLELRSFTGHSDRITSVVFSPDGKMLASGSLDRTINLWNVTTGAKLRSFATRLPVRSVAFSPDGNTIASGGEDETIKLWDVATGVKHRSLEELGSDSSFSVAFSPDGQMIASGSSNGTITLWGVASGKKLREFTGLSKRSLSLVFNSDGKMLASAGDDKIIKLWDVATGVALGSFTGHSDSINSLAFSSDGKTLASGSDDETIRLWDVTTIGKPRELISYSHRIFSVAFSPDGKTLASAGGSTVKLWDVPTGMELRSLTGHSGDPYSVTFSPDGKTLASSSWNDIHLWDLAASGKLRSLTGHTDYISSMVFSGDGKKLASGSDDETIKLWDVTTGVQLRSITGHSDGINSLAFSPDGKMLASGSDDETIKLWDVATGEELRSIEGNSSFITSVAFSPDGKTLASASYSGPIKLWDMATSTEVRSLAGLYVGARAVVYSPDGTLLASVLSRGFPGGIVAVWDLRTGKLLQNITYSEWVPSVVFSPDGEILASGGQDYTINLWDVSKIPASGGQDNTINIWNVATGVAVHSLSGHLDSINSLAFSPDGKTLASGGNDTQIKLWSVQTGKELGALLTLDERDWAVVTPDGRFDASPDGQRLMHWRVGNEVIALEQLKARYYEPHLLAKLMAFNKEPLRDVSKFENPKLYPVVEYDPLTAGSSAFSVRLTNRGGGIGRVQVFVNGKEFLADARDDKLKQNPNVAQAKLNIDLSKASTTVRGKENEIRVVAWNLENYISSRGDERLWFAGGPTDKAPPEVYAIVGGISQYAGSQLNLNFAAKDAADIAKAIELGAKRLFGADKVHLTLLSTTSDGRAKAPTKENFSKAFTAARQAKPTDILIVYLAGHGITLQRGTDTYCYLTQEARTTDTTALSDPAVLKQMTITSEELVEWIKQIPALKQVVMLDTCAAGAAQGQLRLVDKREASGDAVRAIDRAKDRTGSHILMGSAADAVSYEASQYGQGLLTYALLKGMKGPALNNDEFVDISKLFRYAREEVELLAKNIGGIQKPIIFAPRDETFDVGQLKIEDKQRITLATPRPMIMRPLFFDEQTDDDTLGLMRAVRALLRDETFVAGRGTREAALVFVDDEEFPGGIKPTGRYTVEGNKVTLLLRLRQNGIEVANARVTGTKEDVASKVFEAIKARIGRH
jgi:WD40 repeat protein